MFTDDQKRVLFPFAALLVMAALAAILYLPQIKQKSKQVQEQVTQKMEKKEDEVIVDVPKGLTITSPDFESGGKIPVKYTCDGENVNPELYISNVPEGTKSMVLVVDDPDAPIGTYTHWIVFNIPPDTQKINENSVPDGSILGQTDQGKGDYTGPCPPSGQHRYFFRLYALDYVPEWEQGVTRDEVMSTIKENVSVADYAELMGVYSRK